MPQTSVGGLTGNLTISDLDGLGFASDADAVTTLSRLNLGGGRLTAYAGASITNGTGASNAAVDSYRAQVPKVAGMHKAVDVSKSINGGVAGETSTQILARIPAMLTAGAELLVLGPDFGTNSAGNGVSLTQYQTDVIAAVGLARAARVPVIACTTAPRKSADTAPNTAIQRYNLWLTRWATVNNVPLADTWTALVDPTTGYLAAANDSGDGIHPTPAGHLAIAVAIAPVLSAAVPTVPWPVMGKEPEIGLVSNPLMAGGGTPTGWSNLTGSFPSPAFSSEAATAGDGLPAGVWGTMTLDGSGGSDGYRRFGTQLGSGWSTGDKLLACAYINCTNTSGVGLDLLILDQAFGLVADFGFTYSQGSPGPVYFTFTVPSGKTTLYLSLTGAVTHPANTKFRIGAAQVYNLTTAGLASAIL